MLHILEKKILDAVSDKSFGMSQWKKLVQVLWVQQYSTAQCFL